MSTNRRRGIDSQFATVLAATARVSGVMAHWKEQTGMFFFFFSQSHSPKREKTNECRTCTGFVAATTGVRAELGIGDRDGIVQNGSS